MKQSTKLTNRTKALQVANVLESEAREGMSEKQARELVSRLLERFGGGRLAGETVAGFVAQWTARKDAEVAKATARKYRDTSAAFLAFLDNPEKIRALPPMNNDLCDKVLLLRVAGGLPMPMPTNTDAEEEEFASAVRAALPAFVHELLEWEPPAAIANGRFGMQVWQHPEIVDSLWEQEPGSRFAFLLDRELFPEDEGATWEAWGWGKAVALHEQVTRDGAKHARQFASVARHEGAFTQMLGILFKKESEGLARERRKRPEDIAMDDPGRAMLSVTTRRRGTPG